MVNLIPGAGHVIEGRVTMMRMYPTHLLAGKRGIHSAAAKNDMPVSRRQQKGQQWLLLQAMVGAPVTRVPLFRDQTHQDGKTPMTPEAGG